MMIKTEFPFYAETRFLNVSIILARKTKQIAPTVSITTSLNMPVRPGKKVWRNSSSEAIENTVMIAISAGSFHDDLRYNK